MPKAGRERSFAPIPMRAIGDTRLSGRHFRVLGAVAFYDRFGKNGQGCWAGSKTLAAEASCSETHLSDALTDLRLLGYIVSDRHPMNRRTKVHRILYSDNTSQIQEVSEPNTSRLEAEHFPTQKTKPLNGAEKSPPNIFSEITDIKKRDFAEAMPPKKAPKWTADAADKYLTEVEAVFIDETTRSAAHCECKALSEIADEPALPEEIRNRAAGLRTMARAAT
jgi:hypothetical protein